MSLLKKTIIVTGLTLIGLIIILYSTSQAILMNSFINMEKLEVGENIQRAQETLTDELSYLNSTASDWAAWDDTYDFVEDTGAEYIESNLLDTTFTSLKINFIIYIDNAGSVVFGKGLDLNSNSVIPIPETLVKHFVANDRLLTHQDTGSSLTGIVNLPEGPLLVASRPIVTSEYEGPIRGTLIMGRYLDAVEKKRLADKAHLSLTFQPVNNLSMPDDFNLAKSLISQENPFYIHPLSEDVIAGYAGINDIYGDPALLLKIDMPREIYRQGKASVLYFLLSVFFVGLVFFWVDLMLLGKVVLSRLAGISDGVSSIGARGDLSARIQIKGNDELAGLAGEINRMLQALEQSQKKLQENEQLFRLLAENARDIIYRYRFLPKQGFEYVSPSATAITGYAPEEFYADPDFAFKIVYPDDRSALITCYQFDNQNSKSEIMRWVHKNGSVVWTEHQKVPFYDRENNLEAIQGVARDITERKMAEEKLEHLSLHDPLTGLYNRSCFEEKMRTAEGLSNQSGIVVCDVDGLKLVNDTLGHDKGDILLNAAARVIKGSFREGDMVARVGGDEFAVLINNGNDEIVRNACNRIRTAVEKYNSSNPDLPLSIAIGFATSNNSGASLINLFKEADNNMGREKLHRSQSGRSAIVHALKKAFEARDFISEGHAGRLQDLVISMANNISLPYNKAADLRLLAQFHDIGKVGIPDRILFKPGPLSFEETSEMRRHCEIGHRIAMSAPDLEPIAEFILKHHEWWNGDGYPLKLKGNDIPLECRILSIADAYDAMTSDRPYRKALSHKEAIAEIKKFSGIQFDPELVEIFIELLGLNTWVWF
ncbi:MAG: diguanylate cyclase [Peptococcaceae bacterium]|nr:diguanylate cyclase [Peptococcaceae bacterium]